MLVVAVPLNSHPAHATLFSILLISMRFTSIVSMLFVLGAAGVQAITCAAGEHVATNPKGNPVCKACPKGTYNPCECWIFGDWIR